MDSKENQDCHLLIDQSQKQIENGFVIKDLTVGVDEVVHQQSHNVAQSQDTSVLNLGNGNDLVAKENSIDNHVEMLEEGEVGLVSDGIREQSNSYQEVFVENINTIISDPTSGTVEMEGGMITVDVNDPVEHEYMAGNVTDGGADGEMNENGYGDCNSDIGLEKIVGRKNKVIR